MSLSLALQDQAVPLRRAGSGSLWGLAAIYAFTEPGVLPLELRWRSPSNPAVQTIRWPIQVVDGGYPSFDIELPPEKGGLLDPELVKAENEKVAAIWSQPETEPAWRGRFRRPIGKEFATSAPFGQRRSYNGGPMNSFHAGQDFSALEGTPVYAPSAGTVVLAEPGGSRNAVIIDHGGGLYSGYWHLVDLAVTPGQPVQPGDLFGPCRHDRPQHRQPPALGVAPARHRRRAAAMGVDLVSRAGGCRVADGSQRTADSDRQVKDDYAAGGDG